jgi:hypothetical protein
VSEVNFNVLPLGADKLVPAATVPLVAWTVPLAVVLVVPALCVGVLVLLPQPADAAMANARHK